MTADMLCRITAPAPAAPYLAEALVINLQDASSYNVAVASSFYFLHPVHLAEGVEHQEEVVEEGHDLVRLHSFGHGSESCGGHKFGENPN